MSSSPGLRVLVSAAAEPWAETLAKVLAGPSGRVVRLSHVGVRSLNRRLSPAEIDAVRRSLLNVSVGAPMGPRPRDRTTIGYVCTGSAVAHGRAAPSGLTLVAVDDHADLTYRAPLWGPNRDELGPRFPVTAGLYRPEVVMAAMPDAVRGIVAEVQDPRCPTRFEGGLLAKLPFVAATNQLASLAILAAHMGLSLAALVVCDGKDGETT